MRKIGDWRVNDPSSARPARDVVAALAVKATLLLALYALFFAPSHRPAATAAATASALLDAHRSESAE